MNGLPYYKAYPRDFFEGTIGMPYPLKSAYRLALDLIYMQGGALPDDPRYIAGLLGCSTKAWNGYRAELIQTGRLYVEGSSLRNHRADAELETLAKLSDAQREKRLGKRKNKGLQEPQFDQSEPEPEPDKRDDGDDRAHAQAREAVHQGGVSDSPEKPPTPPPPVDATFRERMLGAMGVDPSGVTGPNGRMLGTTLDMHEAARWLALGLTPDEIVAQIADAMTRKRDTGPPGSFRYFTEPMRRLAAMKAAPPLTPATLSDPQGETHAGRSHQPAAPAPADARGRRVAAEHERLRSIFLAAAIGTTGTPAPSGPAGPRDPDGVLDRGRHP